MQKTARELAAFVGGELRGADCVITGIAGIREAEPGDVTLVATPQYIHLASQSRAGAIVASRDFRMATDRPLILVENPSRAFARIAALYAPPLIRFAPGKHPTAVIAATAELGADVSIQPHAVVEDGACIGPRTLIGAGCYIGHETRIGSDCTIYPRVVIRERCRIGDRVMIHSGTVIGADGFGYEPTPQGPKKIPQTGIVQIDDDVEIGANVTVDRARFGKTHIHRNVKIDNLVQIAHNVVIGENSIIVAMSGIAGSTVLGKNVTLAAQVGIAGHLEIGDGAIIGAKAGVNKNVPAGERWFCPCNAAQPHPQAQRIYAALLRLPLLRQRLEVLEKAVFVPKKPARRKSKKKR